MRAMLRAMFIDDLHDYCDRVSALSDDDYIDGYPVWIVMNCIADKYKRRSNY